MPDDVCTLFWGGKMLSYSHGEQKLLCSSPEECLNPGWAVMLSGSETSRPFINSVKGAMLGSSLPKGINQETDNSEIKHPFSNSNQRPPRKEPQIPHILIHH